MLQIISRVAKAYNAIIVQTKHRSNYIMVSVCCIGHANLVVGYLSNETDLQTKQRGCFIRISMPDTHK